jgi:hypothetical protein
LSPDVAMTVRFEDVLAAPERFVEQLGEFLDVSSRGFSTKVFGVARRGWLEENPRLTSSDVECLAAAPIWDVAKSYGYARRVDP